MRDPLALGDAHALLGDAGMTTPWQLVGDVDINICCTSSVSLSVGQNKKDFWQHAALAVGLRSSRKFKVFPVNSYPLLSVDLRNWMQRLS